MVHSSPVEIPAPHGRLEGLLWAAPAPRAAAVVCHPHPLYSGTMHNNVTYRLARAFRDLGVTALRFNFRGVGRSTGAYDEGRGEVDDARAALDFLSAASGGVPLYVAGFSFGSRVALRLALEDERVQKALAVGVAIDMFDFDFARRLAKPKAFLHAERDEYGALERVKAFVDSLPGPRRLWVVEGSDHLCTGRLDAFEALAREAVAWLVALDG